VQHWLNARYVDRYTGRRSFAKSRYYNWIGDMSIPPLGHHKSVLPSTISRRTCVRCAMPARLRTR
jgi:hypothetical protein